MTPEQILSLGRPLREFFGQFDECFARSEPREQLVEYVHGQPSDLLRKSVEPIADYVGVPRRTL